MKVGDFVRLTILDHCMRSGADADLGPMKFEVVGRVLDVNKTCVALGTWYDPEGSIDQNTEVFIIIRSCILTKKRLR